MNSPCPQVTPARSFYLWPPLPDLESAGFVPSRTLQLLLASGATKITLRRVLSSVYSPPDLSSLPLAPGSRQIFLGTRSHLPTLCFPQPCASGVAVFSGLPTEILIGSDVLRGFSSLYDSGIIFFPDFSVLTLCRLWIQC